VLLKMCVFWDLILWLGELFQLFWRSIVRSSTQYLIWDSHSSVAEGSCLLLRFVSGFWCFNGLWYFQNSGNHLPSDTVLHSKYREPLAQWSSITSQNTGNHLASDTALHPKRPETQGHIHFVYTMPMCTLDKL
jgi:hypothetical protein